MLTGKENTTLQTLQTIRNGAGGIKAFTRKMVKHNKVALIYRLSLALRRINEVEDDYKEAEKAIHRAMDHTGEVQCQLNREAKEHDKEIAKLKEQINDLQGECGRWHRLAIVACIAIGDEARVRVTAGGRSSEFIGGSAIAHRNTLQGGHHKASDSVMDQVLKDD